jgi:hypothetical protein
MDRAQLGYRYLLALFGTWDGVHNHNMLRSTPQPALHSHAVLSWIAETPALSFRA